MFQTTLSVPLDVKPESADQLDILVDKFRRHEDTELSDHETNFGRLIEGIPTLHFMSMSVFQDPAYDPIFIIEINCDGGPGPFWAHLEQLAGPQLREMLRCCKKPLDHNGILFGVVTAPGSTATIAPYLEAMSEPPSVFHHGNRGLVRERIVKEAELFRKVRAELDTTNNNPYFSLSAADIHRNLRERMLSQFSWLNESPEPRITKSERLGDFVCLFAYAAVLFGALSLPGIIAVLLLKVPIYLMLITVLALVIGIQLYRLHKPLPDTDVNTNFRLTRVLTQQIPALLTIFTFPLFFIIFWFADLILRRIFPNLESGWIIELSQLIFLGTLGIFVILPGLVLWLRLLELRDSTQSLAQIDPIKVAEIMQHEDWVSQNHMGSIVHIRPGVLRTLIIKFGHKGLGHFLRWKATNGYLGSMRTVHYAHWAFLNNNSRLLFFSNFDQSWGSYLDDFIEKAHVGLTLAWGSGVGFPTTRFLIYDGASHGRLFKNWALASRTVSRFWMSAYPELSVDQIERNYRIAIGLRKTHLSPEDARVWVRNL